MQSLHSSKSSALAALVVAIWAQAPSPAPAQTGINPFPGLGGPWRGSASIALANGKSEKMSCRAYYRPQDSGSTLGLAIRCASQSGFKIELRSSLRYASGNVSGNWEERTFNATGVLNGSASASKINMAISGGVSGTMSVALKQGSHSVLIATSGTGFSEVSINLSPG